MRRTMGVNEAAPVGKGPIEAHLVAVKASSLFDAAEQAIQQWSRLWWWSNRNPLVKVQIGERSWSVQAEQVIRWRQAKQRQ
jgi:hypothetical protein